MAKLVKDHCNCISAKYQTEGVSTSYKDRCMYYDVYDENLSHIQSSLIRAMCERDLEFVLTGMSHSECVWPCEGQVVSFIGERD